MPNPRCFYEVNSRLYAVLNWRVRLKPDDVLCLMELNPGQVAEYPRLKAERRTETAVYEALFPPRPRPTPGLDLSALSKTQLADIVRSLTRSALPSIRECSRLDLETLCRFLFRFAEGRP